MISEDWNGCSLSWLLWPSPVYGLMVHGVFTSRPHRVMHLSTVSPPLKPSLLILHSMVYAFVFSCPNQANFPLRNLPYRSLLCPIAFICLCGTCVCRISPDPGTETDIRFDVFKRLISHDGFFPYSGLPKINSVIPNPPVKRQHAEEIKIFPIYMASTSERALRQSRSAVELRLI